MSAITENELAEFGRGWQRVLSQKLRLFELAAQMAGGGNLAVLEHLRNTHSAAMQLSPLQVAVTTLSALGVDVDPAIAEQVTEAAK